MQKRIILGILTFIIIGLVLIFFLLFNKESTKVNEKKTESQGEVMENEKIKISINNDELFATLIDNSSTRALVKELKKGPITIDMKDYAHMEKVGSLGINLPRNDEDITTEAGDLILYQGNQFVIYYDTNEWSLTRLGKIENITSKELKNILGSGNVTITLSLD